MEQLAFDYPDREPIQRRAHVGVVGSGDLEVLLEPSTDRALHVRIRTSVDGYEKVWKNVVDRFASRFTGAARIEINDFGATPGTVMLRLEQAAEKIRA
ncbi:malonate decarboxylase subunit delta [Chondromyces crocatus]|uniref:Malonate decarboxylase acyl carrier protein n=1 Tax=Chondromyces crocatus TaxID=52 RepID=A0A0K1ETA7_CHOCO|nr:malonate decarboxylase subunit delta [Chondromyces crocatus]AKT43887.1 malonate decarboxylase subunit delta [Chondromyces crocatus]